MPAFGTNNYASGSPYAMNFTPGYRSYLFGTLTAQSPDWNLGQGAPVEPVTAEAVTVGESSLACVLRRSHLPMAVAVELRFSGNPGAFEIDVQTSDTLVDADFVTKQQITSGLNASYVVRAELTTVVAKFLRLNVVAMGNLVSLIAVVS